MSARPSANGSISFGLVSIPVHLYTATRSQSVRFHLIHEKDNSRIQQKIFCPLEQKLIDRSELVRGYEVEKNQIVTFTDQELENLEARDDHLIDIQEFLPLEQVDPVYFENAYHLGCTVESARAFGLFARALKDSQRIALARFTMRTKEHLVMIRPYGDGLMLHTMYFADEVVSAAGVYRGDEANVGAQELSLAKRLIDDLTAKKFQPEKYQDTYRERVVEAAKEKVRGNKTVTAPEPKQKAKVINLYDALKASLNKRGVAVNAAASREEAAEAEEQPRARAAAGGRGHSSARPKRARRK